MYCTHRKISCELATLMTQADLEVLSQVRIVRMPQVYRMSEASYYATRQPCHKQGLVDLICAEVPSLCGT